jgi:hypothetical protein
MKTTSLLNLIAVLASITAIGAVQLVLAPSSRLHRTPAPRTAALRIAPAPVEPRSVATALAARELQSVSD